MVYIRTSRLPTPIIYGPEEEFPLGGCKVVRQSDNDLVTVIGAGVTLFEALAAYEELQQEGINIRVIDLYSVKPVDAATLMTAAKATQGLITVEDHYPAGGIGEAVMAALAPNPVRLYCLAVTKKPKTGKPAELLDYEDISRSAIVRLVKQIKQGAIMNDCCKGGFQTRPYIFNAPPASRESPAHSAINQERGTRHASGRRRGSRRLRTEGTTAAGTQGPGP